MNDFDEAAIGQIAESFQSDLRDLKRSMREQFGRVSSVPYSADRAAAAQAVTAALDDVNRTLAAYRLSEPISYCTCCTDPELIARIITVPRDDLSEDDVASVAGSLLYTIGDADDLKYFVPRFCRDVLVVPLYDLDSIFARFQRAGFDGWPQAERRAVRRFLGAAWREALLAGPRRDLSTLTDPWRHILDGMASLRFIGDALAVWDEEHGDAADGRLIELLDDLDLDEGSIRVSGVGNYAENNAGYDELERWLRSPNVRARIDAALASIRTTDGELAHRVDGVLAGLSSRPQKKTG